MTANQSGFIHDQDVVETLPSDGADDPPRICVLPRGTGCGADLLDAHAIAVAASASLSAKSASRAAISPRKISRFTQRPAPTATSCLRGMGAGSLAGMRSNDVTGRLRPMALPGQSLLHLRSATHHCRAIRTDARKVYKRAELHGVASRR